MSDDNLVHLADARRATVSADPRSRRTRASDHYGDDRLREIKAELDLRSARTEDFQLRAADEDIAVCRLYAEARARCKALNVGFRDWIKKHARHGWRMVNYRMRAVRLGVDSQSIANHGLMKAIAAAEGRHEREPSIVANASKAVRIAHLRRLAEILLDSEEAVDLVLQGYDDKELRERVRHNRRPYPYLRRPGPGIEDLIVDSGAFSAYSQGAEIDLGKYCEFIETNRDLAGMANVTFVNLDHIDLDEPEQAAQAGFKNFQFMRNRGLDPMPVYHIGENIDWLKRYLDLGCSYVGLGCALRSGPRCDDFYAQCWEHLASCSGKPLVRVHAFGESRTAALLRYPWASADAFTWGNKRKYDKPPETSAEAAEYAYDPARRCARLEHEVQSARPALPFRFHFVIGATVWDFPTLHAVHHRSALISYLALKQRLSIERLRQFIANPHALLRNEPYLPKLELLHEVAEHYQQRGTIAANETR